MVKIKFDKCRFYVQLNSDNFLKTKNYLLFDIFIIIIIILLD